MTAATESIRQRLGAGLVIPACPLALNARRRLDERRQRALARYYAAAGAGGLAVGVHTTQFAIRDPGIDLFGPVLELVAEELTRLGKRSAPGKKSPATLVRIAGVCGPTKQAVAEAALARNLGYEAGLLSLAALKTASDAELIVHCRAVAEVIPVVGFYLQPAAGGRLLSRTFWRRFAEIENVVAIKIAPFNRYQTLDVIRAVMEAGREDIALYTGNDDTIVADLITPFRFQVNGEWKERRVTGGLLGHWAAWTSKAVELLVDCQAVTAAGKKVSQDLLRRAVEVTDMNAALFDAANGFAGCIAGIHEVLRQQGLLKGIWCLNPNETLSPGQKAELDRVRAAYPHLTDDTFVAEHLDEWLSD